MIHQQETSQDLRCFLVDLIVSSIVNIVAVAWLAVDVLIGNVHSSEIELIAIIIVSMLLFANLYTYKTMRQTFQEFSINEGKSQIGLFLNSCKPPENVQEVSQNMYKPKLNMLEREQTENRDSAVDYDEVGQVHEDVTQVDDEIYSIVDPYDTIDMPESEQHQYDQLDPI